MLNNFFEVFQIIKYPLIGLFLCFLLLSISWKNIFPIFGFKKYNNLQRVHFGEIPRLGGLIIYISLWIIWFTGLFDHQFFLFILLSSIPLMIVTVKEDLFHNTGAKLRLYSMILSCLLFFYFYPITFPMLDTPAFSSIINSSPFNYLFFIFSILVVTNGMNLIDGMNGLFSLTALSQLLFLFFIGSSVNDWLIVQTSLFFAIPLFVFLLFNFPSGRIFIGDFGAYFYGFVISLLAIYTFGEYPELLTWLAVLVLSYPSIELLFSFIRKKLNSKSPLEADDKHLHTLIYKKFFFKLGRHKLANNITTLSLFIFWMGPLIFYTFTTVSLLTIFCSILLLTFIYVLLYILISKPDRK